MMARDLTCMGGEGDIPVWQHRVSPRGLDQQAGACVDNHSKGRYTVCSALAEPTKGHQRK